MIKPFILGTDFTGLGSPEEAVKRLGIPYRVAFACDKDKYVKASYLANHLCDVFYDDIVLRDHASTPKCDGYFFGFPCQPFSNAGLGLGFEDARGTLFYNSLEYIQIHRPLFFVGENVKGLLSHDKVKGSKSKYGRTFNTIIDSLALTINGQHNLHKYSDCLNYHVYHFVLNTKDFGIPQNRERVFIVGFRDDKDAIRFRAPKGFKLLKKLKDLLEPFTDEKYNLSDKMIKWLLGHSEKNKEKGNGFNFTPTEGDGIAACINSRIQKMGVDDNYILIPKEGIPIKENTKKGYGFANDGDSIEYSNITSKTRRARVGKEISNTIDTGCTQSVMQLNPSKESGNTQPYQQNRVYDINGLSPALTAEASHTINILLYYVIRRLTPKECFRLQGFSDDFFEKCAAVNSDTQLYKQAGNSITVDTMMYLLIQIFKAIDLPLNLQNNV